jgi:hypothetical protein
MCVVLVRGPWVSTGITKKGGIKDWWSQLSLIFEIEALPFAQHGCFSIQKITPPFMLTENFLAIMYSLEM